MNQSNGEGESQLITSHFEIERQNWKQRIENQMYPNLSSTQIRSMAFVEILNLSKRPFNFSLTIISDLFNLREKKFQEHVNNKCRQFKNLV